MKRVLHVVGARPNFMKIAPIMEEMARRPQHFEQILVHTGQHYDANMSQVFFDDLGMPTPDVNLEVGSASHAQQTAQIMQRFEPILLEYQPDWLIVPGDVNSTIACALVASKMGIKVAHVESGLRSFDRGMPEELNRILTDHLSDLLFTTEPSGNENLRNEGVADAKVRFVGNTMIDTLIRLLPKAQEQWTSLSSRIGLDSFVLVTLHRPSNVDEPNTLNEIVHALLDISRDIQVVFPIHPRTRQRIGRLGIDIAAENLLLTEPFGYLDFLALEANAALVLTDSGGVQEETTYLGIPCLTARPNTERPITLTVGTNRLVESSRQVIVAAANLAMQGRAHALEPTVRPELWDGCAAQRIVNALHEVTA